MGFVPRGGGYARGSGRGRGGGASVAERNRDEGSSGRNGGRPANEADTSVISLPPPYSSIQPSVPLSVDPKDAKVAASGGRSIHSLANPSSYRIMFKMTSTDTELFRFRPSRDFIDAGGSTLIEVVRENGSPKTDTIYIKYGPAPEGVTDIKDALKAVLPSVVTIPCKAE